MGREVELGLLGPLEVHVDGMRVDIRSAPQRAILTRLALAEGRTVPTAALLETLWREAIPNNALGKFQNHVSRLRRLVGGDTLMWDTSGYRLTIGPGAIDIGRAEHLVEAGRAAATTDPRRGAELLGRALDTWRGEPFADLPDPLVFAAELGRLEEWRRVVRDELFELRLAAGDHHLALPDLIGATAEDPLRERLALLLARALRDGGRTADALRELASYRRRLAERTGLDAGPAVVELEHLLLAGGGDVISVSADPGLQHGGPDATAGTLPTGNGTGTGSSSGPPVDAVATEEAGTPRLTPRDRFVGRAEELALLLELVEEPGIVTIVGPGGMGKTRLALELLERIRAPACVAGLAATGDGAAVARSVASTLGLHAAPEGIVPAIADRLGGGPAVLFLDNCEHVLDDVRDLAIDLTRLCPDLVVLATSRKRIDVRAERVVRLEPLSEAEQVELFVDRAQRARPQFDAAIHREDIVAIGRLVDALPLGLELAAHRESVFGVGQLRARLTEGIGVLERSVDRATVGHRGSGLAATVEWSYRLLEPDAQVLFDRLSVCLGGFTLNAVDHLAGPTTPNGPGLLAELVEASLVVADLTSDPPRYRLLDTTRRVGESHLDAAATAAARDAHAAWIATEVQQLAALLHERSPRVTPRLRAEAVNIRDALAWLARTERWADAGDIAALVSVMITDDPNLELIGQIRRLDRAATEAGDVGDVERGMITAAMANAEWTGGDAAIAARWAKDALDLLPAGHDHRWVAHFAGCVSSLFIGDPAGAGAHTGALLADQDAPRWIRAAAVCCAAMSCLFTDDRDGAEDWLDRHLALVHEVGAVDGMVAYTFGELAARDDPTAALELFQRAHTQCAHHNHTYNRNVAAVGRLGILVRTADAAKSAVICVEVLDELRDAGMWTQIWIVLRLAVELLEAAGESVAAATVLAAAERDPMASAETGEDRARLDAIRARLAERLGERAFAAARATGRREGRPGAVSRAREALIRVSGAVEAG